VVILESFIFYRKKKWVIRHAYKKLKISKDWKLIVNTKTLVIKKKDLDLVAIVSESVTCFKVTD